MMKNILKVAFVAAIAVATGIQVFNAQKTEALPEVAMANVEALAADDDTLLSKDCEVYCEPDERYSCYIDWGEDTEIIKCPKHRIKRS